MNKQEADNYLENRKVLHPAIVKVWEKLSDMGALKGLSGDETLEVVISVCEGLIKKGKEEGETSDYPNGGKLFEESDIPLEFWLHESDPDEAVKFTREQTDQVNKYVGNHPEADMWEIDYDVYPMDKHKTPDGLYKCEKCGEYKGKVMEKDLNWDDYFDKTAKEKSEKYLTVSCLCDGILCPRCNKNKIHRPVSNSYDGASNSVEHNPYFAAQSGCIECQEKQKK